MTKLESAAALRRQVSKELYKLSVKAAETGNREVKRLYGKIEKALEPLDSQANFTWHDSARGIIKFKSKRKVKAK